MAQGLTLDQLKGMGATPVQPTGKTLAEITAEQTNSATPTNPLEKVAGFLGVDKLGKGLGIATSNALGTTKELSSTQDQLMGTQTNLLNKIREDKLQGKDTSKLEATAKGLGDSITSLSSHISDIGTGGLTNKEVLGSAAQTALNVALAGTFNPESAAFSFSKNLAPETVKSGISEVFKRIGTSFAKNAAAGGALGVAQGVTENKSLGDSLKQGLTSGTISGILGAGATGAVEGVRNLTAPQLVQKIYNSALGVSKKVAQSGKSPSTQLIKEGVVGTAQSIYDRAQNSIDSVEPQIASILKKSPQVVDAGTVFQTLANGVNRAVGNVGSDTVTTDEIKQVIQDSLPQVKTLLNKDTLTLADANKLRQVMDRTLGDRAFMGATLPYKKDVLLEASNELRGLVQGLAPETKPLFKDYSNSIKTIQALNNEMSKPHNLRHMLSLLGAVGGGPIGVAGAVANELGQTTIAKTSLAVGLNAVHKGVEATDKSLTAGLVKKFGSLATQNIAKSVQP